MWSEDRCYVIAEAGSNHDGDFSQAQRLIEIAADALCDAVKFQCLPPFEREWAEPLQAIAHEAGLDFLATPFDVEAVRFLDELRVPAIKIASAEIMNEELLEALAETERPLILSTGMCSLEDIERALDVISQAAPYRAATDHAIPNQTQPYHDLCLLQCTTKYPAMPGEINLRAIDTIRERFDVPVGFSDHSLGISIPIAATAFRPVILEKHFTIDRDLEGPDHSYAIEPDELKAMVEGIRTVELAMGDGKKDGPVEGELVEARGRRLAWT